MLCVGKARRHLDVTRPGFNVVVTDASRHDHTVLLRSLGQPAASKRRPQCASCCSRRGRTWRSPSGGRVGGSEMRVYRWLVAAMIAGILLPGAAAAQTDGG